MAAVYQRGDKMGSDNTPELKSSESASDYEPIVIIHVDTLPLVDKGCRVVGHAQALVDYATPLLEKMPGDSLAAYNAAITIASCCWKQAATQGTPEVFEKYGWPLVLEFMPKENPAAIHGLMLERFLKMFPYFDSERDGTHLHEAVVDPPPQYKEFDESKFELLDKAFPLTMEELPIAELGEFVNHAQVNDKPAEDYEAEMQVLRERLTDMFADWLGRKGVSPETADDLGGIAYRFLEFLYNYSHTTYTSVSREIIAEFFDTWFIRKCAFDPAWMSMAPVAVKILFHFLFEKKLADDVTDTIIAVDECKPKFFSNLRLYVDPRQVRTRAA